MIDPKDSSVLPPVRKHLHDSRIPNKRRSRENKLFDESVRYGSTADPILTERIYTSSPQNENRKRG